MYEPTLRSTAFSAFRYSHTDSYSVAAGALSHCTESNQRQYIISTARPCCR